MSDIRSNAQPLPSFTEQIAYVYDDYMDTLGGGERSALAYALALKTLGFTTEIVSRRPLPPAEDIRRVFGDEFSDITMRHVKFDALSAYLRSSEPMVFVNHTYMSFAPNVAKIGIYSQMFPGHSISKQTHPSEWLGLSTYQLMLSNSTFTKNYADTYWNFPAAKSFVLHPPIGSESIRTAESLSKVAPVKKRQFVTVGRFNPGNHNKNQKLLIESFIAARAQYADLRDWRLICVGNVNQTPEAIRYFNECQALASRHPGIIRIVHDATVGDLGELLTESFGYVHGTGAFIPPGQQPHRCEHFGLSIVEAMAHGCIPLVYARGGIFDVLRPGDMGIPYITPEGLIEGFAEIAAMWDRPTIRTTQLENIKAAINLGQASFTRKLADYLTLALEGGGSR